ncbi:MAG: hypothetical protein FE834_09630, partial [Gammaproteobacteria bacterium]|nr:hypothetical protein [Gammaproteobacteria bacterium]
MQTSNTQNLLTKITHSFNVDAFNRKVREQHTGFDGRLINSDTYYDNLGKVTRTSLPYFEDEQAYFITTQYDPIGRLTHTTKNAIGKIIRIDEPEGAWLTHKHDAIGNLIQTNVGGVITTMTYDNHSNKISMNDPDMGKWTHTYNALGELTSQTDAKNQTSTMQDSLVNTEAALAKASELEQKANAYIISARNYQHYADVRAKQSAKFAQTAQALRHNADKLDEIAAKLQQEAQNYNAWGENYLIVAKRFTHLSNMNVADNTTRSYTDVTNKGTYNFYRGGGGNNGTAISNANGYAQCSSKQACEYWKGLAQKNGEFCVRIATQKAELAQKYIDSSGAEKQAFANQEADKHDAKSNYYAIDSKNYLKHSNTALEKAQTAINQANYWKSIAANTDHWQRTIHRTRIQPSHWPPL